VPTFEQALQYGSYHQLLLELDARNVLSLSSLALPRSFACACH